MRSFKEQAMKVKEKIMRGYPEDQIESKEIIAEDESRILVRCVSAVKIDYDTWLPTISHEIWTDKEKYKADIPFEYDSGQMRIYRKGISGADEQELLNNFNNLMAHVQ